MAQQHKTLKEIKQDAADSVRREKEGIRGLSIRYGTASEGEKLQAREAQKTANRIREQRNKQAAGEDVQVERFTTHDANFIKRFGLLGEDLVDLQAQEEAKQDGIQFQEHNQKTLADAEQRQKKIDAFERPRAEDLENNVNEYSRVNQNAVSQIVEGMQRVFDAQDVIAQLNNKIAQLELEFRRLRTFSPWGIHW